MTFIANVYFPSKAGLKSRYKIKIHKFLKIRENYFQGIGIKGKEMALIWHEKASRTALQTSSVQTHNMTTVKEIAKQFCQLSWIPKLEDKSSKVFLN